MSHSFTLPTAQARLAIAQLARACRYAAELAADPWEFAVSLTSLLQQGIGESDLRWLCARSFAEHATEVTTAKHSIRRFLPEPNLGFGDRTCFVLTDAGLRLAGSIAVPHGGRPTLEFTPPPPTGTISDECLASAAAP